MYTIFCNHLTGESKYNTCVRERQICHLTIIKVAVSSRLTGHGIGVLVLD